MSSSKPLHVARCVAACAVTALYFGVSHAGEPTAAADRAQTVISYTDLDLSKEADVRTLYGRLRRASDKVCGEYGDLRNLRMRRLYDACYQDTLARAVDSVGHAAVKALFAADPQIRVAGRSVKTQART